MSKKKKKKVKEEDDFVGSFGDEGVVEIVLPDPIIFYDKSKAIPKMRNKTTIELKRQKN